MKTPNDIVLARLNELANLFEKAATIHSGIYAELHEHAKYLRVADMTSAARATERINDEHMKLLKIMDLATAKLNEAMRVDPEWFKEAMVDVDKARAARAREAFVAMVEDWSAEKCREAIEHHLADCANPTCDFLPIVEERLARHEPH